MDKSQNMPLLSRFLGTVVLASVIGGSLLSFEWIHAAGRAEFRIFRQQILNTVEDVQGDALCGGRIMLGDVRAQGGKIVNGFRGP